MPMMPSHMAIGANSAGRWGTAAGEADQAVGGGLQEDAGEVHGAGGGRLGVGVRQPGMHRHHWHLHCEGDEKPSISNHSTWGLSWVFSRVA